MYSNNENPGWEWDGVDVRDKICSDKAWCWTIWWGAWGDGAGEHNKNCYGDDSVQ